MILTTLSNKSICVTTDMPDELATVAHYRQFTLSDRVMFNGYERSIYDVTTELEGDVICNVYKISSRIDAKHIYVTEYSLLKQNPRPAPSDIYDAIVNCLPNRIAPFTSECGTFITGDKL